jgi:hypothetical protein
VSFKGAPKEVGKNFDFCGSLHVKNMNGLPKRIHGNLYMSLRDSDEPDELEKQIRKISKIDGYIDWCLE